MNKDKALDLALKELLFYRDFANCPDWRDESQVAITAIKKALANEALEKMAENARELGLDYEPAQRTWVGLTDEDLEAEFGFIDELLRDTCYRTEAKLRGKNT